MSEEKEKYLRKVSSKLQVTLPRKVCERLGIHGGDYVQLIVNGDKIILKKVKIVT